MSAPVTVSVTRHVDPDHEPEMVSWLQAGTTLAGRFPGFLGAGWVRPESGSETWHALYRFADTDSLMAWEQSHERAWWRASATGLGVVESRVERRTGIEGWFDDPVSIDVVGGRTDRATPPPTAPPRWKQAVTIWLAFFPLSLIAAAALAAVAPGLALLPRVLVTTLLLTPAMTYLVLPRMTAALAWWLAGEPAPWRHVT